MSQPTRPMSRRNLFAGAATVGTVAAAARFLPSAQPADSEPVARREPPARGGGYQLTEHVRRYFKTTLI
jgi:hypothetical protein